MNKLNSKTGTFPLVLFLAFLFGLSGQIFAEQKEFKPYLSNTEMNRLISNEQELSPQFKYKLNFKGTFRSASDPGIYHLKIEDINVGWNGTNVLSDLKLIFSFRVKSNDYSNHKSLDLSENVLGSFKEQMNRQNGIFFMSIGKSW